MYLANHVLRAVPVPAGEHRVELRYESPALLAGMVISLSMCGILLALTIAAGVRRRKGACSVEPMATR